MSMATIYVLSTIAAFIMLACAQFPLKRWFAQLKGRKQVNVLGGFAQYIFWDKNEAVIITRKGKEEVLKDKDKGGERFIYPSFGERVRACVSLADQVLTSERKVEIYDSMLCKIGVAIRWVVDDPSTFIDKNDLASYLNKSSAMSAQDIMRDWLKVLTDEISLIASQASFQAGFLHLIVLRESKNQPSTQDSNASDGSNVFDDGNLRIANISEMLGRSLQESLNKKCRHYGVQVVNAAIPLIELDPRDRERLRTALFKRLEIEEAKSAAAVHEITEKLQIGIDRERLEMHNEQLGAQATRIIEVMKHVRPDVKIDHDEFMKIIISLEGRDIKSAIPDKEIHILEKDVSKD